MSLNPKQARFVTEYMLDLNATQAAIRAGYSPATAYSQGGRLLKHVEVCAAIAERQEAAAEKHEVTIESIAAELDLAYKAAAKFKQAGAMVQASIGKAKLHGLIVNKHEQVNELSPEERAKRIDNLLDARARDRASDAARAGESGPREEPAKPVSTVH